MIAIIDYGIGNLRSVEKALLKVGGKAQFVQKSDQLSEAQGLVLPGVGNFGDCVRGLQRIGMWQSVLDWTAQDRPFFGICVGYQMLFEGSEEAPDVPGLGIFKGRIIKFKDPSLKVPQIGWNQIQVQQETPFLKNVQTGDYVYFVHSYYPDPTEPGPVALRTDYGVNFACASVRGNLFGTQFHPEKSQKAGLQLLKNFVELSQ
jgi:imidazole glycerol-phosphate synthase subunit HisH